jgi:hypothetical protein
MLDQLQIWADNKASEPLQTAARCHQIMVRTVSPDLICKKQEEYNTQRTFPYSCSNLLADGYDYTITCMQFANWPFKFHLVGNLFVD